MAAKRKLIVSNKVARRRGRQIIAYIDADMKEAFSRLANHNHRTMTGELKEAIKNWLKRYPDFDYKSKQ